MNRRAHASATRIAALSVVCFEIACADTSQNSAQAEAASDAVAPATDEASASTPEMTSAEAYFLNTISAKTEVFTSEALMPRFEELKPIGVQTMIGTWKGGKFDGGKPDDINWWGKKIVSADKVLPLLAEREDGAIYSWTGLGLAKMKDADFRGIVSASLVYDNGFLQDYFRQVTNDLVVGYSPIGINPGEDLFFHLARVPDVPVDGE